MHICIAAAAAAAAVADSTKKINGKKQKTETSGAGLAVHYWRVGSNNNQSMMYSV